MSNTIIGGQCVGGIKWDNENDKYSIDWKLTYQKCKLASGCVSNCEENTNFGVQASYKGVFIG